MFRILVTFAFLVVQSTCPRCGRSEANLRCLRSESGTREACPRVRHVNLIEFAGTFYFSGLQGCVLKFWTTIELDKPIFSRFSFEFSDDEKLHRGICSGWIVFFCALFACIPTIFFCLFLLKPKINLPVFLDFTKKPSLISYIHHRCSSKPITPSIGVGFLHMDTLQDGKIDFDELRNYLHPPSGNENTAP